MKWSIGRTAAYGALLAAALGGGACAAAAAGAGAGAAYYLTSRGAEGLAKGNVEQVAPRAQSVMKEMNITLTGTEGLQSTTNREYKGKSGDLDVSVELERKSETQTLVKVTAQKNVAEYDKEYARQVVAKIVSP